MYIMIEDPENPGRRLYADLLITTAHSGSNASINVSILSVDVNDVATESSLAAAIANDLKEVEIPETCRLGDIITEYYRVWDIHEDLLQAVHETMNGELMTPCPGRRE